MANQRGALAVLIIVLLGIGFILTHSDRENRGERRSAQDRDNKSSVERLREQMGPGVSRHDLEEVTEEAPMSAGPKATASPVTFRAWTFGGQPYPRPVTVIQSSVVLSSSSRPGYLTQSPHEIIGVIPPEEKLVALPNPNSLNRFVGTIGDHFGDEGFLNDGVVDFHFPEAGEVTVILHGKKRGVGAEVFFQNVQGELRFSMNGVKQTFPMIPYSMYYVYTSAGRQVGSASLKHFSDGSQVDIQLEYGGTLTLRVTDHDTSQPITKATFRNLQGRVIDATQSTPGTYLLKGLQHHFRIQYEISAPGYATSFVQLLLDEDTRTWHRELSLEKGQQVNIHCLYEGEPASQTWGKLFYRNLRPWHRQETKQYCAISDVAGTNGMLQFLVPKETEILGLYVENAVLSATRVVRGNELSIEDTQDVNLRKCEPIQIKFEGGAGVPDPLRIVPYVRFQSRGSGFGLRIHYTTVGNGMTLNLYPQQLGRVDVWSRDAKTLAKVPLRTPRPQGLTIRLPGADIARLRVLDAAGEPESGVVECFSMDESLSLGVFPIEADGTVRIYGLDVDKCRAFVRLTGEDELLKLGSVEIGGHYRRYRRAPNMPWYLPDE